MTLMSYPSPSTKDKTKILFICLGNICRSPAAQGFMQTLVDGKGLGDFYEIDSAGIGNWHVGQLADPRMRHTTKMRGFELTHRARQFDPRHDFKHFDLIITMDPDNYRTICSMAHNDEERRRVVGLVNFLESYKGADSVPDPYYGGQRDFDYALDLIEDGCAGLLKQLEARRLGKDPADTEKVWPRLIILDFDGTIGDTNRLITATMAATLKALHLPAQSEEACSKTIGLPLEEGFFQLLPMSRQTAQKCADTYRVLFEEMKKKITVTPFPHVLETLRRLHQQGVKLSLASSRRRKSLSDYVTQMGLEDVISYMVGADDVEKAKPDPQPVTLTLSHYGLSHDDALVVGDMTFDILMGKRAGCRTCGVTYGNGSRADLSAAGATWIIDDFAQLASLVRHAE